MSYMLADVRRLKQEVLAAIPNAEVSTWGDYGFRLEVSVGARHCIACQPGIDETEVRAGQPEIFRDVTEIKHLLELH